MAGDYSALRFAGQGGSSRSGGVIPEACHIQDFYGNELFRNAAPINRDFPMNTASRKKVLWLTQGADTNLPSLRLRVLNNVEALAEHFEHVVMPAPKSLMAVWRSRNLLRQADLVILQKELLPYPVLKLLRLFSRRLAFDFDDAVYTRMAQGGTARPSRKRSKRFRGLCRACDVMISGNPVLSAMARSCGARRVEELPTPVDYPEDVRAKDESPVVVIGWIGTDVNLPYLEGMEDIFCRLAGEGERFVVSVMSGRPPRFRDFTAVDFRRWSVAGEADFLAAIDIGLMPLADNEHTRGKCAYKALQYMAYGKPVVVSDVGINAEWTAGAGFSGSDSEGLYQGIRKLIHSAELRKAMGAAGRRRVIGDFSRTVVAQKLAGIIDSTLAA